MVHSYCKIHGYPTCYVLRAESKTNPMHARWAVRLAMTVLAAAAGGVAHADIYSFVDAAGVTHFSNVPVDNRYRLLLATPAEERAERPRHWLAKTPLYGSLIDPGGRSAPLR